MKNANPLSRLWLPCAALVLALFAAGCGDSKPGADAEPKANATTWFRILVGPVPVRMQLAVAEEEMARGLMGRRDLAPDQGMLFVYRYPTRMSFYMRNTPTPLDIGFFDEQGVLREIYPLYPFDEKTVASHSNELKYALEVNQGWFKSNNIRPGAKLDLPAVEQSLKDRGF
ncbi:DUF192 domain-containing protein [Nibricoccus sp. IMCC34717]|uniref:DUF192 domain-containing protein n=1 Tax=Nibricoccus sp. IMCC34717 TaxID=3034021 RepID=UPI00384D8F3B